MLTLHSCKLFAGALSWLDLICLWKQGSRKGLPAGQLLCSEQQGETSPVEPVDVLQVECRCYCCEQVWHNPHHSQEAVFIRVSTTRRVLQAVWPRSKSRGAVAHAGCKLCSNQSELPETLCASKASDRFRGRNFLSDIYRRKQLKHINCR